MASQLETPVFSAALRQQWLLALALFCTALWLYTRHNDFPFYYHPDEPTKVTQIRDGTRNFNHPLLLLTATDAVRALTGGTADCQRIVEIGRTCSAIFAATAVAAFSWLGFQRFGVVGGLVTGVAILIQRRLYEHAHFMKEDAALLAGIGLTFVAIDAFSRKPTLLRAVLLGAAAALAMSAKYIGLVMLPLAMLVIIRQQNRSLGAGKLWAGFGVALFAVLAIVNFPAVQSLVDLAGGFRGEIARLNSRAGVEQDFSRLAWLRRLLDVSPILLLLFLYHLRFVFRNFRQLAVSELLLTAFPFLLGLILSFSSKQSGRHMLPALIVVVFLAAIGAVRLARELHERRVRHASVAVAALLICAFIYDVVGTASIAHGFQRDHRRELVEWITANVPAAAVIGVEDRVGIPYEKRRRFCDLPPPIAQQVRGARFAADLGTLDTLRASGITYIAITPPRAEVFVKNDVSAAQLADETFRRRREFYQQLFAQGRLVWSRETGNVGVLNPELRLYEIASPAPARLP